MSFKSGVTTRVDNAQAILDALRSLTKKDVLVGIPSEDSEREDVPFGNAGIGYVNEYGSPAQNIPPRPHLIPGVNSVEEQTVPQLKAAAQAALDGNAAGAERALNRAGTLAANGVRRQLDQASVFRIALSNNDIAMAGGQITDQNTDGNITLSGTTAQPASIATDGVYIVRGIMYTGDTRGQAWYMDMMCEARGAADLRSASSLQREVG